jgi:hypothetical protein
MTEVGRATAAGWFVRRNNPGSAHDVKGRRGDDASLRKAISPSDERRVRQVTKNLGPLPPPCQRPVSGF